MKTSLQKRNKYEQKCRQKIRSSNFEDDFKTSLDCERAINGLFMIFAITPINVSADYEENISQNYEVIKHTLQQLQRHYSATKFYTKFEALFSKDIDGNTKEFGFYSKMKIMLQASNIDDVISILSLLSLFHHYHYLSLFIIIIIIIIYFIIIIIILSLLLLLLSLFIIIIIIYHYLSLFIIIIIIYHYLLLFYH